MPTARRHPLSAAALLLCATLVAVLLLATALTLFWPTEHLRSSLTDLASERLGTRVTIDGDVQVRLWPRPTLKIQEVSLGDGEGSLAAGSASLRWLPLLRGRLVPTAVYLDTPALSLVRDRDGVLNIDPRDDSGSGADVIALWDLHIQQGTLRWEDQARDQQATVTGLALSLPAFHWRRADDGAHPLSRLSLSANASATTLRYNALTLSDISLGLSSRDGALKSSDWQMSFLDSPGAAEADMDFSEDPARWALTLQFDSLQAAALPDEWLPGDAASGSAGLSVSLTSRGNDNDTILQHLDGTVRLSGQDMVLHGIELDEELARFQRTQRFSLVDAGAVIFAGPAWLAATKGSEFVRLLDRAKGDTDIVHLLSAWTIEDGVAHADDVAMATHRNRIALKGDLDLPARRISDAAVAVLNKDGCAVIQQRIHGSFSAPEIEEPDIVDALLGAPLALLRRGLDALSLERDSCEVFYQGEVAAPAKD